MYVGIICMYVGRYVRTYVGMYACMHVCTYACIHAHTHIKTIIYVRFPIIQNVHHPNVNPCPGFYSGGCLYRIFKTVVSKPLQHNHVNFSCNLQKPRQT